MIGKTLGHFEITAKLGEGGMGEVYRAHDTTLGREVALKILPERFMEDPDRLARFKREARVLASLTHPNVAAIHEVGEDGNVHYLVMELVEGETLAERISRGPLPPGDAFGVAVEIARAVEAAHARGIVHRDLKPANVKIAPGGGVKVLDFGLAKALEPEPESRGATSLANSPTLTHQATQAGVLLGTAAYMSPEQARGQEADRRSDIWALGVVLYEMLTGRKAFPGTTMSDVLASVLKTETDWNRLPPDLHPELRRLLERCLEKDSDRRLHDVADARVLLEDAVAGRLATATAPTRNHRTGPVMAAGVSLGLGLASLAGWLAWPSPSPPPLRKTELLLSGPAFLSFLPPRITPDGRRVAYIDSGSRLMIRDFHGVEPLEVHRWNAETLSQGFVFMTFWSPDGRWLAFATKDRLYKVPAEGGEATLVARLDGLGRGAGGAWLPNGRIVYVTGGSGLLEVSDQAGDPRPVLEPSEGERNFDDAVALPDGRGVLFVAHREEGGDTLEVFAGGRRKQVLQSPGEWVSHPVYSPSGHILYDRHTSAGGIWAVPFSLDELEVTGEPFLVAAEANVGSIAGDGTLVYIRDDDPGRMRIARVDAKGEPQETLAEDENLFSMAFSPDGRRLALAVREGVNDELSDLWVQDLDRGTRTRLTFQPGWLLASPSWSPDGREIAYGCGAGGASSRICVVTADGTGTPRDLGEGSSPSFTSDARGIVFARYNSEHDLDLWLLAPLDGEPTVLVRGEGSQYKPCVAPGGAYLAYESTESGRPEIYLTRFPDAVGKWQVSSSGGRRPTWSDDGSRIYYLRPQKDFSTALMEIEVTTKPALALGRPRQLFVLPPLGAGYSVAPDGEGFAVLEPADTGNKTARARITVVQNWYEEFRERGRTR